MSRISVHSSLPSDVPSCAIAHPKLALRQQIDRLESRKQKLKQNAQIPPEKIQELELFLLELNRFLECGDMEAAALLYIKCLSFAEELERLSPVPILIIPPTPAAAKDVPAIRLAAHFEEQGGMDGRGRRRSLWNRITGRGRRRPTSSGLPEERDGLRDLWGSQLEFFLSCLGFIVGGGNTLRFPSMIFEFGGAFFIPHLFFMVIFGLPLAYMHLAIGQYSGLSASAAFYRMMPIASGLGWALVLLAIPVSIYYIFYVAWGFYYLWFALHGLFANGNRLAWEQCRPEWVQRFNCCELRGHCFSNGADQMTAPEAFFHFQVLNRTLDIQEAALGPIQDHLVISLVISWVIVFFAVFKGLGSIGRAVSFTATIPYFLLVILLLRSVSLKGASTGLAYLFKPEISKLWCLKMWRKAAEQVFYSLGIDAGPLISMASFSRYRNNIYRDAVMLVTIDTLTSVLCGMVIFSFIGFMTTVEGIQINDIQKLDPTYIAFTVYPGVTSHLEWGFVWAILFFTILTLSALDAEFAWLEMIASSIMNRFGSKRKSIENRLLISLCIFCCLCGIPFCTRGGIYIFHAIENLNSNWNSFSLSLVQVLVVCHVYGVDKFLEDIAEMLRIEKPPASVLLSGISREQFLWRRFKHFFGPCGGYIKWMWSLFAPIVLTLLLLASILGYERVQFGNVELPFVFELIAWVAMTGPLLALPGIAIWYIYEVVRHNKPLKSVFSTSQWRNRDSEEESKQPRHQDEGQNHHLYAYIDPLSRGASAKSTRGNVNFTGRTIKEEDEKYSQLRERLKRWEETVESTVGAGTVGRGSNLTDRPELDEDEEQEEREEGEEEEEEGSCHRMRGRLRDWEEAAAMAARGGQQQAGAASAGPAPDLVFGALRQEQIEQKGRNQQQQESASETQSQSKADSSFLFGPPPQQFRPPSQPLAAVAPQAIEMANFSASLPDAGSEPRQRLKRPKPIGGAGGSTSRG